MKFILLFYKYIDNFEVFIIIKISECIYLYLEYFISFYIV